MAAAIAAAILFSCNKNSVTPDLTPVAVMENARIQLSGDNGGYACFNISESGAFVLEYETGAAYENADKYLHLPLKRICLTGDKDVVTTYLRGTYTVVGNEYVFDGVGKLRLNAPNGSSFIADLTLTDGTKYSARYGKLTKHDIRGWSLVEAPGSWAPKSLSVTLSKEGGNEVYSYDSADVNVEKAVAAIAADAAPALGDYLDMFRGYNVTGLSVSEMNVCVLEFEKAQNIGGYWSLLRSDVSYSKKMEDDTFSFSAAVEPKVEGDRIVFSIDVRTERTGKDNNILSAYTADIEAVFGR